MADAVGGAVAFPVPAPRHAEVFVDPRDEGRALRVSWHRETRTVVLSLWRAGVCIGTHRLGSGDVARLAAVLSRAASTAVIARRERTERS
jgi:hypothetical protein